MSSLSEFSSCNSASFVRRNAFCLRYVIAQEEKGAINFCLHKVLVNFGMHFHLFEGRHFFFFFFYQNLYLYCTGCLQIPLFPHYGQSPGSAKGSLHLSKWSEWLLSRGGSGCAPFGRHKPAACHEQLIPLWHRTYGRV